MARKFLSGKPTVDATPVVTEARQVATSGAITGGGDLSADRTITARAASTSQTGVVQLTDSTSTTDSTVAATATAVKSAKDAADAAVPKSTVTTAGDLIVATGNAAVTRLAAGTSGAALVSTGTSSAPAYSTSINGTAIPSSATLVTTTRTISTTAPLTGGGDLSTDRTLAINDFTGDSGSGGTKGAVPAPAAGDAAAGKYLKADGTWATVAGGGGAPSDATYVTLSTNGTLTNERVLTAGNYVTVTDAGAGSTVTVAVDAATANTVSKVVARDGSGNFSAGTITAALTGTASGNIPNTLADAKGDLIVASANDTWAKLTAGTNDYVLTADSTATYGVAWKAASGGGGTTSVATLIKWGYD